MSYLVSARKYRPASFDTVIGQRSITTTLRNAIVNHQLAHAYLFCGPRGVGKTTCARIFAKTINCTNPGENAEPCNECESCRAFNDGRSLNIHELDAASNNSVDDIRGLVDQVRVLPRAGKYSVYIVDEVHMLSTAAFNAFLKTLEEPPAHAIFILATTEKHKILPTILSRCQVYDFNRIKIPDTVEHLKYIAAKEGVTAEEEALDVIAQKADGAMRDALSIFDQVVSFCGNELTHARVIEDLNVLDHDYYFRLAGYFHEGRVGDCLLLFNEIMERGFDAGHLLSGLGRHFRNLLVAREPVTVQLVEASTSVKERYTHQAAGLDVDFILDALLALEQGEVQYKARLDKRFSAELTLIKLTQLTAAKKKSLDDSPLLKIEGFAGATGENAPVPALPATPAPVATSPADPSPTAREEKPHKPSPPASFKLKEAIAGMPVATTAPSSPATTTSLPAEPFDLPALVASLECFASTDVALSAALTAYPPLLEGHAVTLRLDNDLLLARARELHPRLLDHLQHELHNGHVTLDFLLYDERLDPSPTRRLYTARDKLDHFLAINPAVQTLRDRFTLEIP
jgi:DNA polymerase-3 subunit gamma/tau